MFHKSKAFSVYGLKEYTGCRNITPLVLNLSTRWSSAVSITRWLLCLWLEERQNFAFANIHLGERNCFCGACKEVCPCILKVHRLIPWNRVHLEKLTSSQPVMAYPAFYRTGRFVTTLTKAHNVSSLHYLFSFV
jgi:hypothetical protein